MKDHSFELLVDALNLPLEIKPDKSKPSPEKVELEEEKDGAKSVDGDMSIGQKEFKEVLEQLQKQDTKTLKVDKKFSAMLFAKKDSNIKVDRSRKQMAVLSNDGKSEVHTQRRMTEPNERSPETP